jgi:hypothetical protein
VGKGGVHVAVDGEQREREEQYARSRRDANARYNN